MKPQLDNPDQARGPAITSYGSGNTSVRTKRWRYILYEDGSEELYDHQIDPNEWTNLADRKEFTEIKNSLAEAIPAEAAPRPDGSGLVRYGFSHLLLRVWAGRDGQKVTRQGRPLQESKVQCEIIFIFLQRVSSFGCLQCRLCRVGNRVPFMSSSVRKVWLLLF